MTRRIVAAKAIVVVLASLSLAGHADPPASPIAFPTDYASGVHYATVVRGGIREELFVHRAAIDAAKAGRPLPSGTVITMEDWRDGRLFRYVVMEKRDGWGRLRPPEGRNGDWSYQTFHPDRSVNRSEDIDRCFACHRPQAGQDFVFTLDRMKSVP